MKIKENKFEGVAFKATPNKGGVITPIYIVMHYDTASNATSAINWMSDPKSSVSAHLHISRDGVVTQLVPFNIKAWHAGVSTWKGLTGLNSYSIGIEASKFWKPRVHRSTDKKAIEVCEALVKQYPIKEIIGHNDIAPNRKADPGKQFPWAKFKPLIK